jgi:hypothetical protein
MILCICKIKPILFYSTVAFKWQNSELNVICAILKLV